MPNGERHNLARIPLRWMIRECFKNCDIIFDAHMLKHECGMDIESIFKAPNSLPPENRQLVKPGVGQIKGFSFARVPLAILKGISLPFRWVWTKLLHLRIQKSAVPFSLDLPGFEYEGEPHEELKDALSPIYDQLDAHWYWKLMEWLPCELHP